MATREGARKAAEASDDSSDDDGGMADPAFMLLPEKEKRKIMKSRAKELEVAAKKPSARKKATPARHENRQSAPPPPASPVAAPTPPEEVDLATPEALRPKTPSIAERNQSEPRNRSTSSERYTDTWRRKREAAWQASAAADARRKRPRQPGLDPVHEAEGLGEEGGEEEAATEEEDGEEEEPEKPTPEETGRPVRPEADRVRVSYKNNSARRPTQHRHPTHPSTPDTHAHPPSLSQVTTRPFSSRSSRPRSRRGTCSSRTRARA